MSDQLKIGLMGTGRIGQVHAASVAAVPGTTLHWVCDPFVDGAKATAEKYGAARVATDPAEVLDSGDVDAIIVASPTPTHVDLISAAIDAGIPVLCEKPIDLDIARVDALREKARYRLGARHPRLQPSVRPALRRAAPPSGAGRHRPARAAHHHQP